eukprot:gene1719-biopygen4610
MSTGPPPSPLAPVPRSVSAFPAVQFPNRVRPSHKEAQPETEEEAMLEESLGWAKTNCKLNAWVSVLTCAACVAVRRASARQPSPKETDYPHPASEMGHRTQGEGIYPFSSKEFNKGFGGLKA